METCEVVARTDDTMTFVYKRRCYKEETFTMSTGDSEDQGDLTKKKKEDGDLIDEKTNMMMKRLSGLCKNVRSKYPIDKEKKERSKKNKKTSDSESTKSKKSKKSRTSEKTPKKRESKKPEDLKSVKEDSQADSDDEEALPDHVNVNGMWIKKGKKDEPCDHRGVPLSHPMAVTPYPGATTAAQREKARKMLKELAQQLHQDDLRKEGKLPPKKEEEKGKPSSTVKTTSSQKTKSSNTSTAKSTGSSVKSTKSSANSRSSNKKMGCDKCGSCQNCIHRCSKKHTASVKVTDYEREQFLNAIQRLRKRIVKPESSRERADKGSKTPYDVTQSDSDTDLSLDTSSSGKSSKKPSKEK